MVALVGESGGGKSTLTKLLPRFHDPSSGAVLVGWHGFSRRDDLQSAENRSRSSLRRPCSSTTPFVTTSPTANLKRLTAEIEEAALIAFAHDFIRELPDGYDTIVGERGIFLSGGQRQRLAIARAILVNAPVLILDEATSALDAESERLVQSAIGNLVRNRTTIVIAHRLSTVRRADVIVVMEAGRIIEMGTHSELLARADNIKKAL